MLKLVCRSDAYVASFISAAPNVCSWSPRSFDNTPTSASSLCHSLTAPLAFHGMGMSKAMAPRSQSEVHGPKRQELGTRIYSQPPLTPLDHTTSVRLRENSSPLFTPRAEVSYCNLHCVGPRWCSISGGSGSRKILRPCIERQGSLYEFCKCCTSARSPLGAV